MYVYWFKPLTRPFHDAAQPDDRPVMTFDILGRLGNGGADILSGQPRRILAWVISDSIMRRRYVTNKGIDPDLTDQEKIDALDAKYGDSRFWFRRSTLLDDIDLYDENQVYEQVDDCGSPTVVKDSQGNRYRIAPKTPSSGHSISDFVLEDGVPVYPGPVTQQIEDTLKGGFSTVLGNYGQKPFYSLSGDTLAVEERMTVIVKGPYSTGDIPESSFGKKSNGTKLKDLDPQEYTEIVANMAWYVCANTWTDEFYGEGS